MWINRAPARAQAPAMIGGPVDVDGAGASGLLLGAVDRGEGRAVDHHVALADVPLRGVGVGDIPLCRGQCEHLVAAYPACSASRRPT